LKLLSLGVTIMGFDRFYPKFAIATVVAVLISDNKVLLVERSYPPAVGKWSFPGGIIKAGERLGEAAKRELKEETGIEAEPMGILWILNNIVRDPSNRVKFHYLIVYVLFDPNSVKGELKAGEDARNVAWFEIDEALNAPNVSRTVKRVLMGIKKFGLTCLPLESVDHETIEG